MNALDVVAKALRRSSRPYDDATAVLTALHEAGFTLRPPTQAVPPAPTPPATPALTRVRRWTQSIAAGRAAAGDGDSY